LQIAASNKTAKWTFRSYSTMIYDGHIRLEKVGASASQTLIGS